ncbi:MAG: ABC transporter ATP-binding protein, partial [Planctomycetes bacterium]|nr:ABC transporter ATP-binding protein [Planctomycetota bacterium]
RRAKHVVVMKNGQCIEHGGQEELFQRGGEFTRLKQLQA